MYVSLFLSKDLSGVMKSTESGAVKGQISDRLTCTYSLRFGLDGSTRDWGNMVLILISLTTKFNDSNPY